MALGPEMVIGPLSAAFGCLITLFIKDRARSAAKEEFTSQIKGSLSEFKAELIKSLDETYLRSKECNLMLEMRDDRLDVVDLRIKELERRSLKGDD